jgi:membrane-bound lytic murein transglycosylase F
VLVTIIQFVLIWPQAVQARSLQEIRSTGELRICFSPIHPSVVSTNQENCLEDCTFSGPAFEAVQAFAAFLGGDVKVRGLRVGWDGQFFNNEGQTVREAKYTPALLASGRCDLYPNNLTKTSWRLQKMDIATMFPNRRVILINILKKDSIRGVPDLAGKVAVVEKDTSHHTWIQEQNQKALTHNPADIHLMATGKALQSLSDGEADFTVIDADAAFWIIRQQFENLHIAFTLETIDEVGWGMRKEDNDLYEAVKTFFGQQRTDQSSALNAIWSKYFGMDLIQFTTLLGSIQE